MRRRKITAVRTETIESWFIRSPSAGGFCSACGREPVWLSLAEACRAGGWSAADACLLVETGGLHGLETPEGHLLICGNSLAAVAAGENRQHRRERPAALITNTEKGERK